MYGLAVKVLLCNAVVVANAVLAVKVVVVLALLWPMLFGIRCCCCCLGSVLSPKARPTLFMMLLRSKRANVRLTWN